MRSPFIVATFAAAAAAVAAVVFTPAPAAHAAETPQQTISRLQQAGYTVNVDRVGSRPLDECVVTSVRNPQTVTETSACTTAETGTETSTSTGSRWSPADRSRCR